jgi:hypothetical protein
LILAATVGDSVFALDGEQSRDIRGSFNSGLAVGDIDRYHSK